MILVFHCQTTIEKLSMRWAGGQISWLQKRALMALAQGCSEFEARRELERNGMRIPPEHVAIPAHNGEGWIFRPRESSYLNNAVLAIAGNSYVKDEVFPAPDLHLKGESLTSLRGSEHYVSLDFGSGDECRLIIEGRFSVSPSASEFDDEDGLDSVAIEPSFADSTELLAPSLGLKVSRCEIDAKGFLTLELGKRLRIFVEPHPKYQAWTFTGFEQVIVCTPGGRVAIFGP
jgi:Family of unknown function (DUF6188)